MVVFFPEHRSVFSEKLLWKISDFTPLGGKKKRSFFLPPKRGGNRQKKFFEKNSELALYLLKSFLDLWQMKGITLVKTNDRFFLPSDNLIVRRPCTYEVRVNDIFENLSLFNV
ncbi:MAG: hypothetical protein SOR57_01290 [Parabacteroides sp.]|nr:hypothetical protein [Parabacteroides sp.]